MTCCIALEPLLIDCESSLSLLPTSVKKLALCSHLRCILPSMPNAFTVSKPTKHSIKVAFLKALARYIVSDSACILVCTLKAYSSIITAPINTGITIGQEIHVITAMKIKPNGISIIVVTVAEVIKSRTLSNERKLLANEPTEFGFCSIRKPSTCCIMRALSLISIRALAQSKK